MIKKLIDKNPYHLGQLLQLVSLPFTPLVITYWMWRDEWDEIKSAYSEVFHYIKTGEVE